MTCGSHEPAGSSTFQTWHEIARKRQVTKYQEPCEKLLMFIEDDMWDRPANSVLIVSKGAGDQKKKANSQKLGVKNNSKKENFYYS
jgi:prophage tail gpP-like protein